jgi:hypothetical protein
MAVWVEHMFDGIGMEHSIASQNVWEDPCACWEFSGGWFDYCNINPSYRA